MTLCRHQTSLLYTLIIATGITAFQSAYPRDGTRSRRTHHVQNVHVTPRSYSKSTLPLAADDETLLEDLDMDLAREIEEALLLANDVWTTNEEDEIDAIADALTSLPAPPKQKEINVSPPEQEPSLFTSVMNDQVEIDEELEPPLPPDSPPSENALSFGESLQKAVSNEINRLKNLLFDLQQDMKTTESSVQEAESTAEILKREIEESRLERETVIKEIETQFKAEKENLMTALGSASTELSMIIDESTKNITQAQADASATEKDLLNQMDEFAATIKQVSDETVKLNMEKEQLMNLKQAKLNEAKTEASEKLLKYKAELSEDGESIRLRNAQLQKKADDAEKRVRDVYESIKQTREDRISLQKQIQDVEKESLEQIATLEKQILEDDAEYTSYMDTERARIDKLISDAKVKYTNILEKEKATRKSVEEDFEAALAEKNSEGEATIAAIEFKAKSKLDELEEKHAAERKAIYQEKVEAVSAVRNEMLAQLQIEDAKLNAIHEKMRPKLDSVREEIASVKAAFEQELSERKQLADVEKNLFLKRMESIRFDMQNKINAQQKEIDVERSVFLRDHNLLVGESEEECRRAWMELAKLKTKVDDAGDRRNELITEVNRKSELIGMYENDRSSFRKSIRLSFQIARQKIGNGARRVLRRKKDTTEYK